MIKVGNELYSKDNINRLKEVAKHQPATFKTFAAFDQAALAEGALSKRLKELIAVACAHITGCPYCIDGHIAGAKKLDISFEELSEAIFVATALKAGSSMAHGLNALNAYDPKTETTSLYNSASLMRFSELAKSEPQSFKAFNKFDQEALKEGRLTKEEKELIAIACAHITGCAYCIDIHVKSAKKLNIPFEQITEAIFVAVALNAGAAMAHSVNALNAYDGGYAE